MPRGQEVTQEWLSGVLRGQGYDVTPADTPDVLRSRHPSRPNLIVAIKRDQKIISFRHYWGLKSSLAKSKELRDAINAANASSWYETFYSDKDGDLAVSSYMVITDSISKQDIEVFLDKLTTAFHAAVISSGLHPLLK